MQPNTDLMKYPSGRLCDFRCHWDTFHRSHSTFVGSCAAVRVVNWLYGVRNWNIYLKLRHYTMWAMTFEMRAFNGR